MNSELSLGALSTLLQTYGVFSKPVCREFGLTQTGFDILMFLSSNPEYSTAKEISILRGLQETIISVNVNRLVEDGFLERRADDTDRRKMHLKCTEKAEAVIQKGREMQDYFLWQMQEGLSEEELKVHHHCLKVIADNAKRTLEDIRNNRQEM